MRIVAWQVLCNLLLGHRLRSAINVVCVHRSCCLSINHRHAPASPFSKPSLGAALWRGRGRAAAAAGAVRRQRVHRCRGRLPDCGGRAPAGERTGAAFHVQRLAVLVLNAWVAAGAGRAWKPCKWEHKAGGTAAAFCTLCRPLLCHAQEEVKPAACTWSTLPPLALQVGLSAGHDASSGAPAAGRLWRQPRALGCALLKDGTQRKGLPAAARQEAQLLAAASYQQQMAQYAAAHLAPRSQTASLCQFASPPSSSDVPSAEAGAHLPHRGHRRRVGGANRRTEGACNTASSIPGLPRSEERSLPTLLPSPRRF